VAPFVILTPNQSYDTVTVSACSGPGPGYVLIDKVSFVVMPAIGHATFPCRVDKSDRFESARCNRYGFHSGKPIRAGRFIQRSATALATIIRFCKCCTVGKSGHRYYYCSKGRYFVWRRDYHPQSAGRCIPLPDYAVDSSGLLPIPSS